MIIERARVEDAEILTHIALTAKSHWGYPPNWVRHWTAELTVTPEYINTHPTYLARGNRQVLGFCAICVESGSALLEHLWVLPSNMGTGVGRELFKNAERIARDAGAAYIRLVGDPHAEGFYSRMGATLCGRQPAPIDGQERFLPIFEKVL
jgi:GNAT superfamily N-acetyltransferase